MSEVKPVHRYKAQTLFSFGGAKIEYFPRGPEVVLATDFDAQRLRADTAEAENRDLRLQCGGMQMDLDEAKEKLAAAEQRIAKFEDLLWDMRRLPQKRCAAFVSQIIDLLDGQRAALNPNPEAESHGS